MAKEIYGDLTIRGKLRVIGELTANQALRATTFRVGASDGPVLSGPKPVVTGSRAGNAALASLLSGLESIGLIRDNSGP